MQEEGNLVATVLVERPLETVWEKWIYPADIMQWNTPFENWHCPEAENDVREGGSFYFRMERKDGSEGFDHKGVYDKVVPYEMIAYTLAGGRKSVIEFQQIDENTIVREIFEPDEKADRERQRAFCQSVLNRFKKYVEAL